MPYELSFTKPLGAIDKPHHIEFCTGGTYKGDPKAMFEAMWTFETVGGQTKVTIRLFFLLRRHAIWR
ncbi:MAG: hypothetical protein NVS3B3_16460 [Aquirhabdus sp.]